jgi:hypothetical protein
MRIPSLFFFISMVWAQAPGVIPSRHLAKDVALNLDPQSTLWTAAKPVIAENDRFGQPVPGHRTEIRSRWSSNHLYLFYICPYEKLHLKPSPVTTAETNKLWDWDVAEAFIGTDMAHIRHYTEYEVSPQGEWVDLDIDRDNPNSPGIRWDSGFETKARIDESKKIWYAAMKIPLKAIGVEHPATGTRLRVNLFRIQGPPPDRTFIAWQPPKSQSYHVPEAFGMLVMEQ